MGEFLSGYLANVAAGLTNVALIGIVYTGARHSDHIRRVVLFFMRNSEQRAVDLGEVDNVVNDNGGNLIPMREIVHHDGSLTADFYDYNRLMNDWF